MDFENINDASQQPNLIPSLQQPPKAGSGSGWKIFWGIITGLSMLGNVMLFLLLIGVAVFAFAGKGERKFSEEVLQDGPRVPVIGLVEPADPVEVKPGEDGRVRGRVAVGAIALGDRSLVRGHGVVDPAEAGQDVALPIQRETGPGLDLEGLFDGFQGLVQTDGLFHHFLVGVSRQSQPPCQCLLA